MYKKNCTSVTTKHLFIYSRNVEQTFIQLHDCLYPCLSRHFYPDPRYFSQIQCRVANIFLKLTDIKTDT